MHPCTHCSIHVTLFYISWSCDVAFSSPAPARCVQSPRRGPARPPACWLSVSISLPRPPVLAPNSWRCVVPNLRHAKRTSVCAHAVHTIKSLLMYESTMCRPTFCLQMLTAQYQIKHASTYTYTHAHTYQIRYAGSQKQMWHSQRTDTGARTMGVVCRIRQGVSSPTQSCFC